MARPQFVSGSLRVGSAASGNVNVTPFTTATDDIMFLAVTTRDNVAITLPAGWTIIAEVNNGALQRSTVAWKRASGVEGVFTITHAAGSNIDAALVNYRGCVPTGDPVDTFGQQANAASTTCTAPSITTVTGGCILVFVMHVSDAVSGFTDIDQQSANLGLLWERGAAFSTGARASISDGAYEDVGPSGLSTGTYNGSKANTGTNVALKGDPAQDPPAPAFSNTGVDTGFEANFPGSLNDDRMAVCVVTSDSLDGTPKRPYEVSFDPGTFVFEPMTLLGEFYDYDTDKTISVWGYLNPPADAADQYVRAYFDDVVAATIDGCVLENVHQTSPVVQIAQANGTSNAPSVDLAGVAAGNFVLGICGAAFGTTQGSFSISEDAPDQSEVLSRAPIFAELGPYRVGFNGTTESGTGTVNSNWSLTSSKPWKAVAFEILAADGTPPADPGPPGITPTACLLTPVQHRADHLAGNEGVHYASQMVNMGDVIGYAYAGRSTTTPDTEHGNKWNAIFFRTYDPATQTFTAAVEVEAAAGFNDPCGNPDGNLRGSFFDKPNLVRLADGRLILMWGMLLGVDSPTFNPVDDTIYGGGIYVRESTDGGVTWTPRVDLGTLLLDIGPIATDGTNVWLWATQGASDFHFDGFVTYGHYDAPTPSMKLFKRTGVGTWAESDVYDAALSTRTVLADGYHYSGADDGLQTFNTPYTSAVLVNANVGMVFGMRHGVAADQDPLTGPGTVGLQTGIACWRTADGGATWKETLIGPGIAFLPGGTEGLAVRARVTENGRIYVTYKRVAQKIYIRHVTSSGIGNRVLVADQDLADPFAIPFGVTEDGGVVSDNAAIDAPTLVANVDVAVNPASQITTDKDLFTPIVDEVVAVENMSTIVPGEPNFIPYIGAFYSDDNGETWIDAGIVSQLEMSYNPDLGYTVAFDVNGVTTMCIDFEGRAYILGLNSQEVPAISIWKSRFAVDTDPATYDYFGCFGTPVDRVFGGWEQSDALVWPQDGYVYELEQFAFNDLESPDIGREELWIIGYPSGAIPETPVPETQPSIPFHRGVIQTESSRHPAGNPTIRRVGR